jgi:hypothetical protein
VRAINWPEVIIGFALGLVPLAARQIYIVIKYIRRPSRRKFLGEFWHYHRSTTGSGEIVESRYNLKYSLFAGRILVEGIESILPGSEQGHLKYSGQVSAREGMVRYFELIDPGSHERMYWYVIDPFYDPFEKTVGLYISLDLAGLPAAGPMILSRRRLPREWVENNLDSHVLQREPLSSEETIGQGS